MAQITLNTANHVVPMIYAYTTPEIARHNGWTKIGYTEQDVNKRLEQQTHTADVEYHLEWKGNAIFDDGSGERFTDHDFHAYLRKLAVERKPDTEWFQITGPVSRGHFYDFRANRGILDQLDTVVPYTLRAEQDDAVQKTVDYARTHVQGEYLWNAKPRFGKTLAVYDFCKRLGAQHVLIVTNRPAIANSWYSDYEKFLGRESGYVEKFKYALLNKGERGRFPNDEEFAKALAERLVYKMHSKHKVYIFERLENHGTVEDKDIYHHVDEGVYSIEHVMPQHLTPAWTKELGTDYEAIHETWLHRLANLTLTGYNSKYSNNPFAEKRDMPNGFTDSGLRMNTWIAQRSKWTLEELEARNKLLVTRALGIWAMPETSFVSAEKHMDSCSLDDDTTELRGRIIVRFSYKNTEQPVLSWINMMEQVLKMLHSEDPSVLTNLAYSNSSDDELSVYVSSNPKDLRGALEIDNGIFVERNTSTNVKISMLRKFFKAYGINPEDLVFYLKDGTEDDQEDEIGTRFELRRRYWAYALPLIQQAHGEGKSFSNCVGSKENWLSGWFGIRGFCLNCIANYNEARVELHLGKGDKDTNKEAFDYLFMKKAAIETALGTEVAWKRNDDGKASQIVISLPGVSIENETDWTQMAKFHAEWSKKFFDVIVPYLKDHMQQ